MSIFNLWGKRNPLPIEASQAQQLGLWDNFFAQQGAPLEGLLAEMKVLAKAPGVARDPVYDASRGVASLTPSFLFVWYVTKLETSASGGTDVSAKWETQRLADVVAVHIELSQYNMPGFDRRRKYEAVQLRLRDKTWEESAAFLAFDDEPKVAKFIRVLKTRFATSRPS